MWQFYAVFSNVIRVEQEVWNTLKTRTVFCMTCKLGFTVFAVLNLPTFQHILLKIIPIEAHADLSVRAVLRCGSAAARLLGLRVRIPSGAWLPVSCECCVLSGREVSVTGWLFIQRSLTKCGVSVCGSEAWIRRSPWSTRGCCAVVKAWVYI
jgi:hypothetical protein